MKRALLTLALLGLASGAWAQQPGIVYTPPAKGETITLLANTNVSVTTGTTNEEILYTITLPANSFPSTYTGLIVRAVFKHAANTNSATGRIRVDGIGGTIVASRASSTSGELVYLDAEVRVFSATSLVARSLFWNSGNVGGLGVAEFSPTLTGAITVVLTGQCPTAAGDIILRQVSAAWIK